MIFYAKEYEHTPVSLLAEMPFIFLGMLQDATVVTTFPDISYLWIYISQSPLQNKKKARFALCCARWQVCQKQRQISSETGQ